MQNSIEMETHFWIPQKHGKPPKYGFDVIQGTQVLIALVTLYRYTIWARN